jgi:hypothetical protein
MAQSLDRHNKADKKEDLVLNMEESDGIQEYSLEEILDPNFDTFDNPREWCTYFVNYINTNLS